MKRRFRPTIEGSVREYVTSPAIALAYDRHYEDTPLLAFDTRFLTEILPREGLLLDIGCGTGRHIIQLTRHGLSCVGMDLSRHMIDLGLAKFERAGLAVPLLQANMSSPLPFKTQTFDHVICMFSTIGLIAGAKPRARFVSEVARILKPGGTFSLHVHNRLRNLLTPWGRQWLLRTYIWDRLFTDLEVGDRIMEIYRGIEDMYLHVFSLREIRRLLRKGGFQIRRVAYLNDARNGEITGERFASIRANGFLIAATKPPR